MAWDFWKKVNEPVKKDINYSKISYKTNTWWFNKALIDKWMKANAGERKEKKALLKEIHKIEAKIRKLMKKGKHAEADEYQKDLNRLRIEYSAIKVQL